MAANPTNLDLTSLEKALASLTQLHQRVSDEEFISKQDDVVRLGLQAGLIKNLEFTYELCWKMMKRWLEINVTSDSVDGVTRRELFRLAAESHLINDVDEWMSYHDLRNQTSHRYDSALAEGAQLLIAEFMRAAERLLAYLKAHND
jgi:nucleotidyltransferase substrate binding protein (TIGR01987 family)